MNPGVPVATDTVLHVDMGDQTLEATVRRSERARTTRIRIGRDQPLQVVIPAGASEEFAAAALHSKREWIRRKLTEIGEEPESELGLDEPEFGLLFGQRLPIIEAPVRYARERDGALLVPAGNGTADALRRWYRRTARRELCRIVEEERARLGVDISSVAIRDQRTRWGSCSAKRHISLNWRLVVAPKHVARYVIDHELCHLTVPNHSRAFWLLLGQACPNWRVASQWLSLHGDELRRLRAGTTPA